MRILWSSNSPLCLTGYGTQTASMCSRLKQYGHDVAISALYGLQGSITSWNGIDIYPNDLGNDWGLRHLKKYFDHFKADVLVTLIDVWVQDTVDVSMPWIPWTPVDHYPVPPLVEKVLKGSPNIIKPIAMSHFGQAALKEKGIDSFYAPHGIETKIFMPHAGWREKMRKHWQLEDKFIVGTVGTNHGERKNWNVSLQAFQILADRHPGEVFYIMHTDPTCDRGINLNGLRLALGIEKITNTPTLSDMIIGIPKTTMAYIYNSLDVFLLPSKGEGFGIPIMEAQDMRHAGHPGE